MVYCGGQWGKVENMSFIGEYSVTLDEKGRVGVPTKFRGELGAGAVVTRGLDTSLFLFPLSAWDQLAQKIAALPLGSSNSRQFSRFMLSGAMDVSLDTQGRFVIPPYLRAFAGLEREAVLVGVYNRLEIWSTAAWNEYIKHSQEQAGEIAELIASV